ncbi:GPI ethanolamine phosphate transferase like protein [Zymoseptoria brevis]|uniref:GPI ethanolamine phosphate transferase 2 n=1 Tax=Zymoseptoria brevis TaxID=1047168 RepID=A0A0F4GR46_9PEZI|nr:GPI ethanolamine phosphate transferase like protein [Zymoseptoria brevis]
MALSSRVRTAALVLANLLLPIAVLVFAKGFFPYKPALGGLATLGENASALPAPAFDRVIFMVVDALRSDFVYGYESGFEFTQSLIRTGAAVPFTAHATPPTVTMPRVKALTTGSVPSFLDLILNFAESDTSSSLSSQDTWLSQIREKGGKLIFYGDDTWLKLFPTPDFFARQDGTSSFFVSDFTEVDLNVTRHVPHELKNDDWNGMIMHYLGLDHIGHKTGPQGPNMLPKQKEMDDIVKLIYEAMEKEAHLKDTLLVMAGDHGMNAGGNHGGSGPGETEPALVFASPKLKGMRKKEGGYECPTTPKEGTEFHYYTKVEQSDLIPTLAGLMGLPISRNSLGVSISEMEGLWSEDETVTHLRSNAQQVVQIVEATYGEESFRTAVQGFQIKDLTGEKVCHEHPEGEQRLACLWAHASIISSEAPDPAAAKAALMVFLHESQSSLSGTASSYNIPFMATGMALTTVILLLSLLSLPASIFSRSPTTPATSFFGLTTLLYTIMMFASSYVEEEQQFWYWLTPAWVLLLSISALPRTTSASSRTKVAAAAVAVLAVHRLMVRWNQTGQKHSGAEDIVHTLFPLHHNFMWMLILLSYAVTGWGMMRTTFADLLPAEVEALVAVMAVVPAIVFKLNFTQADAPELVGELAEGLRSWTGQWSLLVQAQFVFLVLGGVGVGSVVLAVASARARKSLGGEGGGDGLPSLAERLHYPLTLFLMTQTRAPNVPLFLGMEVQRRALGYLLSPRRPTTDTPPTPAAADGHTTRVLEVATTTLLLTHTTFFATGGSNSISSIDLSNAYNGVSDYNVAAVGGLLFVGNWAGGVWWCSAAVLLLNAAGRKSGRDVAVAAQEEKGGRDWVRREREREAEETKRAVSSPPSSHSSSANHRTAAEAETAGGKGGWQLYLSLQTTFIACSLLGVMASCTALRTHLFIWTVFSPKFLYAMAWSGGWHLGVNVMVGGLAGWLSGWR